jgi:ADP-ribosyl-[dinitrogen reductase] hydrolase
VTRSVCRYEFNDPANLPARESIDMTPPPGFRISGDCPPAGTWSDDGAQALCLLASLLHSGRLDLGDLTQRLIN